MIRKVGKVGIPLKPSSGGLMHCGSDYSESGIWLAL